MGYRYAILGAGRQGLYAAYDLARFGEADTLALYDLNWGAASRGAEKINRLLNREVAQGHPLDVTDTPALLQALKPVDAAVSAVPYLYNLNITEAAIEAGTHVCDLGGHTPTAKEVMALAEDARGQGIAIVPDCGMAPGLNINLGLHALSLLDEPEALHIYDAGLPLHPVPPWNYVSTFHINGLTNEYYGNAWFLRDGEPTPVPCLTELETLEFEPPLGTLEAAVTSGGLSLTPWRLKGKLRTLENKTLRYPGHWQTFEAYQRLGLFEMETVQLAEARVVPRELFHALLEPKLRSKDARDICIIRVEAKGQRGGRPASVTLELRDTYDENTGFTAMEKMTGGHAAIVAHRAARGDLPAGPVPVDDVLTGKALEEACAPRGWQIRQW